MQTQRTHEKLYMTSYHGNTSRTFPVLTTWPWKQIMIDTHKANSFSALKLYHSLGKNSTAVWLNESFALSHSLQSHKTLRSWIIERKNRDPGGTSWRQLTNTQTHTRPPAPGTHSPLTPLASCQLGHTCLPQNSMFNICFRELNWKIIHGILK